jgi:hypothetical protein
LLQYRWCLEEAKARNYAISSRCHVIGNSNEVAVLVKRPASTIAKVDWPSDL